MTVPKKRPKIVVGQTECIETGCGHLYVTMNSIDGQVFEVFTHLGKAGGCATAQLEAMCRLVSIGLRAGIEPFEIFRQLRGIRCPSQGTFDGCEVLSCADGIAQAIGKLIPEASAWKPPETAQENDGSGDDA
jgi:ribonucleoside-diphosphate reductase alpha chain